MPNDDPVRVETYSQAYLINIDVFDVLLICRCVLITHRDVHCQIFLCSDVCQKTSLHRTTRETNKCMLPHSHDYHMKISSDFNEVQMTP
jgi:hypothetical protein